MIKKIGDEILAKMTTDDYIMLSKLFIGKGLENLKPERFKHLVELGIVEQNEDSVKLPGIGSISISDQFLTTENKTQTKHEKKQALIQALILEHLRANPNMTQKDIMDETGYARNAVQEAFAALQKNGLLKREGSKMNGFWVVKEGK